MRFKGAALAAVLAATLGLVPATARDARADVVASLPISSFGQIVADTAHGHLFITQASGDTILVTDLFGTPVTTITGESGVDALALSPGGNTLYAALGTAGAVSAISTTTLTETARYSLSSGYSPVSLAVQSGKIWVSYTDTAAVLPTNAIGEIDPAAATFTPAALSGNWPVAPVLSADPSGTGRLVARDDQYTAASYDVSASPVTTLAAPNTAIHGCAYDGGVTVLPGGMSVIMPCAGNASGDVYRTSDLSQITSPYSGVVYPSIAVAPNGLLATGDSIPGQQKVVIYPAGGGAAQATDPLSAPNANYTPAVAGMSWAADGSGVFTVIRNHSDLVSQPDTYTLREFFPTGASTTLTVWGSSAPWIGRAFSLTGTLKSPSGPVAPGITITVHRSCPGGAARTFTTQTGKNGAFIATDTVKAPLTCTYIVSSAVTSALAPARARITVTWVRARPVLTVSTSAGTVNYQSRVKVTVHLGSTDGNRKVALYAARPGITKRLLWSGAVNSAGNVTVRSPALPRNTHFLAVFTGDAGDYPVTAGTWVHVRVRVLEAIAGYYKTARGTPAIRFFHRSGKVKLAAKVIPDEAGQCFRMRVQFFTSFWTANTLSGCGHLSGTSLGLGYLTLKNATLGRQYRIRIDYVPGKKDHNAAGHGQWMYFIVTK